MTKQSVKKMGFAAVMAMVFGSQIGSGIFVLPSTLAQYGMYGIFGWFFAGVGAVFISLVFAYLCAKMPKTGGPHVYVYEAFGKWSAFFTGWTYWLVSWISTSVVVITAISYLSPFIGNASPWEYFLYQILLLSVITYLNCFSVEVSGKVEFVLTILKFIPFIIVPILIFPNFSMDNIKIAANLQETNAVNIISVVTFLCFWGFIGVECATTPAECIEKPEKTIPKAIIIGTISVALVYIINNIAITGAIPAEQLAISKAPYVDAVCNVVGKNTSLIMALIASIVCIGTLNAWVLASSQIALGLAKDKLLPDFFAKTNKNKSPYISVLISCVGMVPFLALTIDSDFAKQIENIVGFSVVSFIFIYLVCSISALKLLFIQYKQNQYVMLKMVTILSILFCSFMIYKATIQSIVVSLLFVISGFFVIPFLNKDKEGSI